jgi:hypothetical protein
MHAPAEAFLKLCTQAPAPPYRPHDPLSGVQIELMASAIHKTYRRLGRKAGRLKKENDRSFSELSDFFKDSNRAAAARMLEILGLVGLRRAKGHASPAEEDLVRTQLEYSLEALAEAEHDGWMAWHFARGWRYGPRRDDQQRLHNCLRPFAELPKREADKDRETIRHYPDFAATAHMKIVFPGIGAHEPVLRVPTGSATRSPGRAGRRRSTTDR